MLSPTSYLLKKVIILKNEKLNLSNTQREILTIRNLMQTMKGLGLVRGIPGAKGGYLPAELACETLGFGQEAIDIPIYRNEELSGVTLHELRLKPPNSSILHVLGDTRDFKVGDKITIASSKLIICGRVQGRNDLNNSLLSSIEIAFLRE
jgi:predicted transcriptional regulator